MILRVLSQVKELMIRSVDIFPLVSETDLADNAAPAPVVWYSMEDPEFQGEIDVYYAAEFAIIS